MLRRLRLAVRRWFLRKDPEAVGAPPLHERPAQVASTPAPEREGLASQPQRSHDVRDDGRRVISHGGGPSTQHETPPDDPAVGPARPDVASTGAREPRTPTAPPPADDPSVTQGEEFTAAQRDPAPSDPEAGTDTSLPGARGESPVSPEPREMFVLTDFSTIMYSSSADGYPAPPGLLAARTAPPQRRWLRRTSTLPPALIVETVRDLDVHGDRVVAALRNEPATVLWPASDDSSPSHEFLVPEPLEDFVIDRGNEKGHPRTLDRALPSHAPAGEEAADDFDRLELVRLLALVLEGLHSADLVAGDLRWETFLFALHPRPAIVVQRPESLRRLGGEYLTSIELDGAAVAAGSPFDTDRRCFAEIAHRLLVTHDPHAALDPWIERRIPGLSEQQVQQARRLWERADGEVGTRPQIAEWKRVLGVDEQADVAPAGR